MILTRRNAKKLLAISVTTTEDITGFFPPETSNVVLQNDTGISNVQWVNIPRYCILKCFWLFWGFFSIKLKLDGDKNVNHVKKKKGGGGIKGKKTPKTTLFEEFGMDTCLNGSRIKLI